MKEPYIPSRKPNLRNDENGFNLSEMAGTLLGVLIFIIFALALVLTVRTSIAQVNSTKSYATGSPIPDLVNLILLLFILGIAVASSALVFVAIRASI